jgi:2-dehydropantoate 2-reductase
MHLTILGTGALACLFGARLAPHADVTLLGTWAEGVQAIREDGIRLEAGRGYGNHLDGDAPGRVLMVRATTDPREAGPADVALILVKSWQTGRAATQAAQVLAPGGIALTLQNGLGNLEQIQAVVGEGRALLGVTTLGATLLGPGHVRAGGDGPVYLSDDPRLGGLGAVLRHASFDVRQSPLSDLQSLLWGKLAVNCGINALTALLRVPNGELLECPEARLLMERAAQEAAAVAQARGIRLPYADAAAQAASVARATAANRSSMLQDVERGAPTEIEAINGAVAREGRRLGVAAPVNEALCRLVSGLRRA